MTCHELSPYQSLFKSPYLSLQKQRDAKVFLHRYQTDLDTEIRKLCWSLQNLGLIHYVTVDRRHMTCARRTTGDPLTCLRSKDAILSLFDASSPHQYELASRTVFPGVPVVPLPDPSAEAPAINDVDMSAAT